MSSSLHGKHLLKQTWLRSSGIVILLSHVLLQLNIYIPVKDFYILYMYSILPWKIYSSLHSSEDLVKKFDLNIAPTNIIYITNIFIYIYNGYTSILFKHKHLIFVLLFDFIHVKQTVLYKPKYCIIEVRNKWSRFSPKLELFQQLNTNCIVIITVNNVCTC